MKRLHGLILQEIIPPVVLTFLVLSFVVFTREFGRLAELLIRRNADFLTVAEIVIYLLPSILIFTVPFAFLIGALIGFSRLSAESEIVAMRAGGISIFQILLPVFQTGLVVMMVTGAMTLYLLPWGNWNLRLLRHEIRAIPVQSEVKPRIFYEEFPGILLYVEDVDLRDALWKGIFVADSTNAEENKLLIARQGYVVPDPSQGRLQLHFEDGTIYRPSAGSGEKGSLSHFGRHIVPINLPSAAISPGAGVPKRSADMTLEELWAVIKSDAPARKFRLIELNRRLALPLACPLFAILAVTLGIQAHRGGRGYGFILSMFIAFSYYVLFATGTTLSRNDVLPVSAGIWGPNFILLVTVLVSLRLASRESTLLHWCANCRVFVELYRGARFVSRTVKQMVQVTRQRLRNFFWELPSFRLRLARVIDLYMARSFVGNLLAALLICMSLFYLFTFFELIDDVFTNERDWTVLLDYFFYLLPHVLLLLVPISVLIGVLVTFGMMERTNQVVALKASGVSIYRMAFPVFALASLLSGSMFVLQEYVLPVANQQQDNLRNLIKGRPAQTSQPGEHWIFGEDQYLFHYGHFNPDRKRFSDLSVYNLDLSENLLEGHIYAQRAHWSEEEETWILESGWERRFDDPYFERFAVKPHELGESPSYFSDEVTESSKMTYLELQQHIEELQKGGFEVDDLKTELYKKLSFPMVPLIMAFLGLPFALKIGKKGALYGVAAGVLIGILYWGTFGIFDVLGSSGILAPILAAWGPNVMFTAGAVIFLSAMRT